ncbi:MAG: phytoene desaturase family protein [Bacteroidales bacterium]
MEGKQVIIIGAGIGGLTTAVRLLKKGYNVRILEKNKQAGGRLNKIEKDGFTFDAGPSFFSMSYEFKEFADQCGIELPFEYEALDPLYVVNMPNGRQFHLYKDPEKLAREFEDLEPGFAEKLRRYLDSGRKLFESSMPAIIKQNHPTLASYLKALMQSPPQQVGKLFRNFYQEVSRYFDAEETRAIISLVSFFLGRSPFQTSAIYTLLSYMEFEHDGYYNVKGGMYKIVEGLVKTIDELGGTFDYETDITQVVSADGGVDHLIDAEGKSYKADIYVCNADAATFRGQMLHRAAFSEEKLDRMNWTFAPLTIYLGVEGKVENLNHHNYFLGTNYKGYATGIFTNQITLEKPYYYVNVLSHSNKECAPEGKEALFIVCPMPDLRYKKDWGDTDVIVENIIADLSERIQTPLKERIVSKTVLNPVDWQKMFHLHRGSGLGLAHDIMQIGYFRPGNVDEVLSNLYYVGASTVPGTGLPMCLIGSGLVTERIVDRSGAPF